MTDLSTLFQCLTWVICVSSILRFCKWYVSKGVAELVEENQRLHKELSDSIKSNNSLKDKLKNRELLSDLDGGGTYNVD